MLRPGTLARVVPMIWLALTAPVALAQVDNALYLTGEGVTAHLRGDPTALPAGAARCANCHEPAPRPESASASFAPRLDARLAVQLPRRGGPPSAYDAAAFCQLLRTGLDPANILVRRIMPVYEIDAGTCTVLWEALSQRVASPETPR